MTSRLRLGVLQLWGMQELAGPHKAIGIASQQAKLIARFTTGQVAFMT